MFDKKKYWERRKQGLPGQENLTPEPTIALWTEKDFEAGKCSKDDIGKGRISGVEMQMTKKGLVAFTRRMKRQKIVDRHTTKKGFVYGTRIGGKLHSTLEARKRKFAKAHKGERIPTEEQRIHAENYPLRIDPSKTNHQRMLARKEKRDAAHSTRRAASSAA